MTGINWAIKAREFLHCNCDYGCPCQFNSRPTKGDCRGVLALDIEQGHHGNTKLDGLKVAAVVSWPGAIHEGHGTIQLLVVMRELHLSNARHRFAHRAIPPAAAGRAIPPETPL